MLLKWVVQEGIESAVIDPGKPWQNGTNESFNGKFRDECLAMEWFRNRIEAEVVIEDWRVHYHEVRPHSSINYQTPNEFRRSLQTNLSTGAVFGPENIVGACRDCNRGKGRHDFGELHATGSGGGAMEGTVGKIDFHTKAYVCTHILTGERPVLLVDRGNGDWCFLCGADHEDIPENFRVGGIGHIVERDPTLNEILDLPIDFEAEREIVGGPWIRMRKTDEGGEPH